MDLVNAQRINNLRAKQIYRLLLRGYGIGTKEKMFSHQFH